MTPGILTTSPASGSVSVAGSSSYSVSLSTANNIGAVTYVQDPLGQFSRLSFDSATGVVTTTGTLAVGTYAINGTTSDAYGDTGTWSFALTVTPETLDTTPISDAVSVPNSASYSENLSTTGNTGSVIYTQDPSGQSPQLSLHPTTGVVTTTGTLAAGTYAINGTSSDPHGDTGPWSFDLAVTPGTLTTTPASDSVGVANSASYVENLVTTGNTGSVTYAQASLGQSPQLLPRSHHGCH